MSASPLITVLLPVYNGERYLARAVNSILTQTYRDFELLIMDDGSTDHSADIIRRLANKHPCIRLVSRSNTGIVGALNAGIELANGQYIARMDADDIALPNRLESQLNFLQGEPDVVALGSRVAFVDPQGSVLKLYKVPTAHEDILSELLVGNGGALIHPSVVFRKRALMDVGGYREAYKFAEDYDLYLRLLHKGKLANLESVLLLYRFHADKTNYCKSQIQARLVKELLGQECERRGIPFSPLKNLDEVKGTRAAIYRQWTFWAIEGGQRDTARKYAVMSWLLEPLNRESQSCLKYVLGREWHSLANIVGSHFSRAE